MSNPNVTIVEKTPTPSVSSNELKEISIPNATTALWWAHASHEGIQRSDRRVWSHADGVVFLEDKG